ncbi:MAG TPA: hypothetical protein VGW38_12020, partial [Chloroflexota bacterium]|nr:hypothetical protein [Chloroflexota bacterium]
DLRGVFFRLVHDSKFSKVGVSSKPGAVQLIGVPLADKLPEWLDDPATRTFFSSVVSMRL